MDDRLKELLDDMLIDYKEFEEICASDYVLSVEICSWKHNDRIVFNVLLLDGRIYPVYVEGKEVEVVAIKKLRDKTINVRATDRDVAILKTLSELLKISQGEVISMALELLYRERK